MIATKPRGVATALGLALLLAGCAGNMRSLPSATELEAEAYEDLSDYIIGPQDILQVSVWRQPELSVDALIVRPDGKISLPLLDDVQAAGLAPVELKALLTERWGEFITSPQVTVIVRQINSKLVYVLGEVARQGPIPIRGDFRVVDALSASGGFGAFAGKDRVKIIRTTGSLDQIEFHFNYGDFIDGKNLDQNITLLPGDRIVVPEESPFWE